MNAYTVRIYIARHCKTEWNVKGRLQGKSDPLLSEEGRKEARTNCNLLIPLRISLIISSPQRRAIQTSRIYGRALGVPVDVCEALREFDHGCWEGRSWQELLDGESSDFRQWMEDPGSVEVPGGAELVTHAQERILTAVHDLSMSHSHQTLLLVSHKHILALLLCALNHLPLKKFKELINNSIEPYLLPSKLLDDILQN